MKFVPEKLTRSIGRAILKSKKNSPHIFFVGGVIGVVGAGFLACRATLKLEENLDEIKQDFTDLKLMRNSKDVVYPDKVYYNDLGIVYCKSAVRLGKLYGPALIIGSVSIAALTGSHVQMTRRNKALTVTLALVSQAFEEYRARVREELGDERERDLYQDMHPVKIDIDGKKELVKVKGDGVGSIYAKYFDSTNPNWRRDGEYNRTFIQCQQTYWNQKLHATGHVFLNDVYDSLGFEHTTAGAVVGWLNDGDGDGYITFDYLEAPNDGYFETRNGFERKIILDFNVDGVIYDLIEGQK